MTRACAQTTHARRSISSGSVCVIAIIGLYGMSVMSRSRKFEILTAEQQSP